MTKPRIAIVISTTRQGRFGDRPAQWIAGVASKHPGTFEIVDLRDHPLPFFDEPRSPAYMTPSSEAAQAWGDLMDGFDGYIFVTAEYNRTIPAVLKNALDYLYPQLTRKPAAFVGYGAVGGARAVEHLRQIAVELQMVPTRPAVHIAMAEFRGMLMDGKDFADFPYLADSAEVMLEDLLWWTAALKNAREEAVRKAA
jgi:NAD(P)H-dependent FMN reductase